MILTEKEMDEQLEAYEKMEENFIYCVDGSKAYVGSVVRVDNFKQGVYGRVGRIIDISQIGMTIQQENGLRYAYSKYDDPKIELVSDGTEKPDMVNHPPHYQSETGLEVIDVIEAFTADLTGVEAVCTGNVLKYICRWKKKNGLEDLKKTKWYLERLIKHVEKLENKNLKECN